MTGARRNGPYKGARTDRGSEPPLRLSPTAAFLLVLAVRTAAAASAPIQDCDETFNYWEPTHYLNHGYGLQTWEYSPTYAIRSWFYTGLHAGIIRPLKLLHLEKHTEFYALRFAFGLICALCETKLYATIQKCLTPRVAIFFLVATVASPGMFHASVSYLPSTFAMYTTMMGMSAFMNWNGGVRTVNGIIWFAVGATVGWPFAGILITPFVAEELLLTYMEGEFTAMLARFWRGVAGSLIVLSAQVATDYFFYRKLVVVPWNIVSYNVFSGGDRGPDIYGTEPWHFYGRNLVINFNLWFLLAMLSMPLLLWQHYIHQRNITRASVVRGLVFLSPFYMWLTIFTLQPHKEERFMFPAYPALALNAAIALHIILANLGSADARSVVGRMPAMVKLGMVSTVIIVSLIFGLLRVLNLTTGYTAPLAVYSALREPGIAQPGDLVCLGKEWYRFPTSYLLPDQVRAKFVKSEFTGLLPGEFSEIRNGFDSFYGARVVPSGMNDRNIEDVGKYIDLSRCDFMVDSTFPSTKPTTLEPDYRAQEHIWETLQCRAFLDAQSTGIIGRLFYLPDWPIIPSRLRRVWGHYCLLRRRKTAV